MCAELQPAQSLTDKQQRYSLSGKNKVCGVARNVRNVLAKPFNDFWPVVDSAEVQEELQRILQMLLQTARKIISDEERELLRQARGKKNVVKRQGIYEAIRLNNCHSIQSRKCLSLGVNEVSCSLEKENLCSIIIANEADPPTLTRHLGTLAAVKHVPFVVLPGLKNITKSVLGFCCLAVGLEKASNKEENIFFNQLHLKIVSTAREITEINFQDITKDLEENETVDDLINPPSSSRSTSITDPPKEIYLIRTSKQYRVFVPGTGTITEPSPSTTTQMDYLSLSSFGNRSVIDVQTKPKQKQAPLGSDCVSVDSFAQRMRKKIAISKLSSQSDTQLCTPNPSIVRKHSHFQAGNKSLHASRYFDANLSSLRVKKVQSNPDKLKKKKTNKKIKVK